MPASEPNPVATRPDVIVANLREVSISISLINATIIPASNASPQPVVSTTLISNQVSRKRNGS